MDVIYASSFFLSSLIRLSLVSALFNFNDSLSNVAPVSLVLLPVDVIRVRNRCLQIDAICVSSFF